ncbi:hypothetical protein CSUI_007942, partial [Cystoisospora suis]
RLHVREEKEVFLKGMKGRRRCCRMTREQKMMFFYQRDKGRRVEIRRASLRHHKEVNSLLFSPNLSHPVTR